jgi:hypothetical protein
MINIHYNVCNNYNLCEMELPQKLVSLFLIADADSKFTQKCHRMAIAIDSYILGYGERFQSIS